MMVDGLLHENPRDTAKNMNSRKRIAAIDHFWEPTLVKTRNKKTLS